VIDDDSSAEKEMDMIFQDRRSFDDDVKSKTAPSASKKRKISGKYSYCNNS
jgi:hypothetical protein